MLTYKQNSDSSIGVYSDYMNDFPADPTVYIGKIEKYFDHSPYNFSVDPSVKVLHWKEIADLGDKLKELNSKHLSVKEIQQYCKIQITKNSESYWVREFCKTDLSNVTKTPYDSEAILLLKDSPKLQALVYSLLQNGFEVKIHCFSLKSEETISGIKF